MVSGRSRLVLVDRLHNELRATESSKTKRNCWPTTPPRRTDRDPASERLTPDTLAPGTHQPGATSAATPSADRAWGVRCSQRAAVSNDRSGLNTQRMMRRADQIGARKTPSLRERERERDEPPGSKRIQPERRCKCSPTHSFLHLNCRCRSNGVIRSAWPECFLCSAHTQQKSHRSRLYGFTVSPAKLARSAVARPPARQPCVSY